MKILTQLVLVCRTKGIRIQNIINELSGEKIDVIEWNADPAIYISSALLPAQVIAVDIHEEEKICTSDCS